MPDAPRQPRIGCIQPEITSIKTVEQIGFCAACALSQGVFAFICKALCQLFQMTDRDDCIVHIAHLIANNRLVLAACLNNRDNAVGFFQNVCVGFALVLQIEAQPGDTVPDSCNVGLATDIL